MTTMAVRLPEELIREIDQLVQEGRYSTRTAAVRTALSRLVEDERRTAIDKAIIEGYRRHPPEQPSAADFQRADRSISAEPW